VKGADSTEDNENFSLGEINVLCTSSNDEDKDALIESYRSPVPSTYLGKDEVERYRGTRNTDIFNDMTGVQMNNPVNEVGVWTQVSAVCKVMVVRLL
jgi:hypothetical protein